MPDFVSIAFFLELWDFSGVAYIKHMFICCE